MDVISILQKKRQEVTGFEVSAAIQRADQHPKVFTKIVIEYKVVGKNIDKEAVERAVQLSEENIAAPGPCCNIRLKFRIELLSKKNRNSA